MKFGNDIWLWLKFVIAIMKLLKEIFGDDEDREDVKKNGNPLES